METIAEDRAVRLIAGLLGPVYLLSALFVLVDAAALPLVIKAFVADPVLVVLAGYMTFVPGLAILRFHRRWSSDWRVLVTLSGWLMLVVGAGRVVLAYRLAPLIGGMASTVLPAMPLMALGFAAIGAVLIVQGWRRA